MQAFAADVANFEHGVEPKFALDRSVPVPSFWILKDLVLGIDGQREAGRGSATRGVRAWLEGLNTLRLPKDVDDPF